MKRKPKQVPGKVQVWYGKLGYDSPDVCITWGKGIPKCEANYVMGLFTSKQVKNNWDWKPGIDPPILAVKYEDSFVTKMEELGYDINTLKFSIEKKKTQDDSI